MSSSKNFKLICVSNRHLSDDFLSDVRRIAYEKKPDYLILRERSLSESEYEKLVRNVSEILQASRYELIVHTHFNVARKLGVKMVHFGFDDFVGLKNGGASFDEFDSVGVSIHSISQAKIARDLGANYIIAGHIFDTPSHAGEPGRGIEFLEEILRLNITTYAIGGVNFNNLDMIKSIGAHWACMMREFVK
ncbi:thiamine phosphate synthase [Campylobacter suis]|uniref:Thiazole tautomerase n=1 Tax=Campylobacter suis TaxID=2790657 RepID=A0ABM8Q336_9BACT|nr:thiamine phosphate synthase [Campylobacter suis]CAD7287185.1 Thiazole tautomerase [Campylobacter suis]